MEAASYPMSPEIRNQLNMITAPLLHKLGDNPDYFENSNKVAFDNMIDIFNKAESDPWFYGRLDQLCHLLIAIF